MQDYIQGFLVAFGLISALGAQNVFVIKQAIKKEYTFFVCALCVLCDIVFMSLGVLGFGAILADSVLWSKILALGGIIFLCFYGIRSLKGAFTHKTLSLQQEGASLSLKRTLLATLAITLFNPHMYLDTIILLGSIGIGADSRIHFLLGCISASAAWFALLGFGANALSPYFTSARAWQILEGFVACVMFGIAFSLMLFVLGD